MHKAVGRFGLLTLLFIAGKCYAQSGETEDASTVFRANVLNPGLSYEIPIAPKQTILMFGGLHTSFGFGYSSSLGTTTSFGLNPIIGAEYRYYYNGRKRRDKGRRTALNSMNYLAPVYNVIFSDYQIDEEASVEESSIRPVHTIGAVWGFQRNYKSRFSLDINLGGAYVFASSTFYESDGKVETRTTGKFTTTSQIQIGFWLNKR